MQDLTVGSIRGHVLKMMSFMLVGLVVQTLYSLIDIYWVSRLGEDAIAAVSLSTNVMFIVLAISQVISVGAVALVSQAAGRRESAEVQRLFNQSQSLAIGIGVIFTVAAFASMDRYVNALAGNAQTATQAIRFLNWFIPGMALQFAMVGLGSALRGIGDMKPGMMAQLSSVVLNIILAPFLIFGWLGAPRMGVAGAGLSTLIATVVAIAYLAVYLARHSDFLKLDLSLWRPDWKLWMRILGIGLPAGSEFLLMAVLMSVIFFVIRPFGSNAQAGFGIAQRIMQAGFMPAVALSFGVAAVAGQNFGAGRLWRVRETFMEAAKLSIAFMAFFTLLCQLAPEALLHLFSTEPAVTGPGGDYLRTVSYNFLISGLAFIASGIFQGLGNTWPSLAASASRLLTFIFPVLWMRWQPGFTLHWVWMTSVASVLVQGIISLGLLYRTFSVRGITGATPAEVIPRVS